MKKINLPFYRDNQELILSGGKTSTLRSYNQFTSIGLKEGERGLFRIKRQFFVVTCHGLKGVEDLGGAEKVYQTEGFHLSGGPKLNKQKAFYLGTISSTITPFKGPGIMRELAQEKLQAKYFK